MSDRLAPAEMLLADDAAIDRMAARLLAEISIETGVIHLATRCSARQLVREALEAALDEHEKPRQPPPLP